MNNRNELEHSLEGKLLIPGRELARLIGVDVSTLRRWSKEGHIPAPVRVGGRVLWRADILSEWLSQDCPNMDDFVARPTLPYKAAQ